MSNSTEDYSDYDNNTDRATGVSPFDFGAIALQFGIAALIGVIAAVAGGFGWRGGPAA